MRENVCGRERDWAGRNFRIELERMQELTN